MLQGRNIEDEFAVVREARARESALCRHLVDGPGRVDAVWQVLKKQSHGAFGRGKVRGEDRSLFLEQVTQFDEDRRDCGGDAGHGLAEFPRKARSRPLVA